MGGTRHSVREFVAHYHRARTYQGLGNEIIGTGSSPGRGQRVLTVEPDDIANPTDYRVTNRKLWDQAVDQQLASEAYDHTTSYHETYWPLTDQQGTVRHVYSISGLTDKAEQVKYGAFGKPDLIQSSADGVAAWYVDNFHAGREYDEYSELYYNRARWFDPEAGRFISEDPIGFAGGDANLYRYVGNSPTNATDPSGNVANLVTGAVGAGVGAVFGAGAYLYQYSTGSIEEFSVWDLSAYTLGGAAAGGVAGLTFGASLAVAGGLGMGTVGTTAVAGGMTGIAAGAAGGAVTGVGTTMDNAWRGDATWGDVGMAGLSGMGRGAFYGGVGGAAAGAAFPIAASLTSGGLLGGFIAGSSSAMLGDSAAQFAGIGVGLQSHYNTSQTAIAGIAGGAFGAYGGGRGARAGDQTASPGAQLRQKYAHLTPTQRQARIAELRTANYARRAQEARICFVAGTPVVVGADQPAIAAPDVALAANDENRFNTYYTLSAGALLTAGWLAYETLEEKKRRKQQQLQQAADSVFDSFDDEFDPPDRNHDHEPADDLYLALAAQDRFDDARLQAATDSYCREATGLQAAPCAPACSSSGADMSAKRPPGGPVTRAPRNPGGRTDP